VLIKYLNNGVQKHVSNQIGRGFIDAGLAVQLQDPTDAGAGGADTVPRWEVTEKHGQTRTWLVIKMTVLNRVEFFSGDPSELTDRYFGRKVPELIFKEYRAAWRANPTLRDTMAKVGSRAAESASDANVLTAHEKHNADMALSERLPVSQRR
jgi:hypothetical protein